jgi:hypothetical protein
MRRRKKKKKKKKKKRERAKKYGAEVAMGYFWKVVDSQVTEKCPGDPPLGMGSVTGVFAFHHHRDGLVSSLPIVLE